MTDSQCQDKYVVHEFLRSGELPSAPCTADVLRANEVGGRDILCGKDGFWREPVKVWSNRAKRDIVVDVGQVVHRGELRSESLLIPYRSALFSPLSWICHSRIPHAIGL
jgi:hypothetical protein